MENMTNAAAIINEWNSMTPENQAYRNHWENPDSKTGFRKFY